MDHHFSVDHLFSTLYRNAGPPEISEDNHPGLWLVWQVVGHHEYFLHQLRPIIVMEYCALGSLRYLTLIQALELLLT